MFLIYYGLYPDILGINIYIEFIIFELEILHKKFKWYMLKSAEESEIIKKIEQSPYEEK